MTGGRTAAFLAALMLSGCTSLDEVVFGPTPAPDPRGVTLAPVAPDTPFPSVATVPPRPSLTYSVQQERAIVDALISDREHARYTGQAIRYRAGRADNPPPGPPPETVEYGETFLEPVGPVPVDGPLEPEPLDPSLAEYETLRRDRGQVDEGGIDDFVRDLVDETAPFPNLDTETALLDQRAEAPVPGRKGTESGFQRLFYWLVGDDEEADGTAEDGADPGTTPAPPAGAGAAAAPSGPDLTVVEAAGERDDAAQPTPADAPLPPPEKGGSADQPPAAGSAHLPESSAQLPQLKPDESADPPAPAPVKPDEEDRSPPAPAAAGDDSS